jgi:hypothetical protein
VAAVLHAAKQAPKPAALALMLGERAREDASHRERRDGASQEAADKPDSPGELTRRSWLYVVRKTVREFFATGHLSSAAGESDSPTANTGTKTSTKTRTGIPTEAATAQVGPTSAPRREGRHEG